MSEMNASSQGLSAEKEALVWAGDLTRLTPDEKNMYYRRRCDACGLDPNTQPFLYVTLSGKLVLYATKAATEQLSMRRQISLSVVSKGFEDGCYEVWYRASDASGRSVENMGAVFCDTLKGESLVNAKLKAITKSIRRTVLAFAGLGMLDETELDDIPGANKVSIEQAHGTASLRMVSAEVVDTATGEIVEPKPVEVPKIIVSLRKIVCMVWAKSELELPEDMDAADEDTLCRMIYYGMKGVKMVNPHTTAEIKEMAKAFLAPAPEPVSTGQKKRDAAAAEAIEAASAPRPAHVTNNAVVDAAAIYQSQFGEDENQDEIGDA